MKNTKIITTILACCLVYSVYQTKQNQKTVDRKSIKNNRSTSALQNTKSIQALNSEIQENNTLENDNETVGQELDSSYLEFARTRDLATMDMINDEYNAFVATEFNTNSSHTIFEDQMNEIEVQKLYAYEIQKAQDEEASEELDWDMYISLNETYEIE